MGYYGKWCFRDPGDSHIWNKLLTCTTVTVKINVFNHPSIHSWYCRGWDKAGKSLPPCTAVILASWGCSTWKYICRGCHLQPPFLNASPATAPTGKDLSLCQCLWLYLSFLLLLKNEKKSRSLSSLIFHLYNFLPVCLCNEHSCLRNITPLLPWKPVIPLVFERHFFMAIKTKTKWSLS